MIQSFADKRTAAFYNGKQVRQFRSFAAQAERRLNVLDAATTLQDLAGLSSNRLESLSGDRAGQRSIRINQQWRICFVWKNDGPHDVEIVDYH